MMCGIVLIMLIGVITSVYMWSRQKFSYFRRHNIPEDPGYFPFGSKPMWHILFQRKAFNEITEDIYTNYKGHPLVGYYGVLGEKVLVVNDVELAKRVMIKDFEYFTDRRHFEFGGKSAEYLEKMMTMLKGEKWKQMRSVVSPAFTSGKMKHVVPLIDKAGDDLVRYLHSYAEEQRQFDAKAIMIKFTVDVIGSIGFGIEARSFTESENIFLRMVQRLTNPDRNTSIKGMLQIMAIFMAPKLARRLGVSIMDEDATEFFVKIIRKQLKERQKEEEEVEEEGTRTSTKRPKRHDFVSTLSQALTSLKSSGEETNKEFETAIVANLFVLFFAGFETSSTVMSTMLHFIAKNKEVQDHLYEELREANDGKEHLNYDQVQNLEYMDMVLNESLRMFPLAIPERVCVKDYPVPDMPGCTISKGMLVQIAAPQIMMDHKYFEEADKFRPEHFAADAKANRSPYTFMGFGHGPRNCIGMRLAQLQVKMAIARIVYNFNILPCEKTVKELKYRPGATSAQPIGGFWIKLSKRVSQT